MEEKLKLDSTKSLIEKTKQGDNFSREALHTQFDTAFRNARLAAKDYMLNKDPTHSDELKMKLDEQVERANRIARTLQ